MKAQRSKPAAPLDRSAAGSQPQSHTILYAIAAITAVAGLADAAYLAVSHLTGQFVACGGSAQCSEVLSSKYAAIGNVPLAMVGAVGYFAAFSLATLAAFGHSNVRKPLALIVSAMLLATLWLLYLQAFVLHAYCTYCLLSAACTFVLAGILLAIPPRR